MAHFPNLEANWTQLKQKFQIYQTIYENSRHHLSAQNGICIKTYNFWPKNDGEKWSSKNIFEIPPCAKPFLSY